MSYRKWLFVTFGVSGMLVAAIMTFSYIMDPLWMNTISTKYNRFQLAFDERQLKTNRLTFEQRNYDTLLIGSSRMTYMNPYLFGKDSFNYSASSMYPDEFVPYIRYFTKQNERPAKTIVLGLDFSSVNKKRDIKSSKPEDYVNRPIPAIAFLKNLMTKDTVQYAMENMEISKNKDLADTNGMRVYNRQMVAYAPKANQKEVNQKIAEEIKRYPEELKEFEYDQGYKSLLQSIKKSSRSSEFIILTTPVTAPRFDTYMEQPHVFDAYQEWLGDIIDVFGGVYVFMDINEITMDTSNFFDTHHSYPEVGELMAARILKKEQSELPENFGKWVTEANVDSFVSEVEEQMKQYDSEN
ncbi:hypothetical protein [Metabacillus idriensis]|uniref:hypothetical protein n=1 Tax=Metabacillus idriensis TaxID=324768 RepID=UPI00174E7666|nr:hypothetical protein [Metabacillus idriensis]